MKIDHVRSSGGVGKQTNKGSVVISVVISEVNQRKGREVLTTQVLAWLSRMD